MEGTESLAQIVKCGDTDRAVQLAMSMPGFPNACDSNGLYPLHYAAIYGNNELLKQLVRDYKADPDCTAADKATPLHLAARNGNTECVRSLLGFGALIDAVDQMGWTPLHYACHRGHVGVSSLLIEKGSNLKLCTAEGYTPLHVSCYRGNVGLMEELLKKKANVLAKDKSGRTPMDLIPLAQREETALPLPPTTTYKLSTHEKLKKKVKREHAGDDNDDNDNVRFKGDRDSVTPPNVAEFSPINEDSVTSSSTRKDLNSKTKKTLHKTLKGKSKTHSSSDDSDNNNNDNDDDGGNDDGKDEDYGSGSSAREKKPKRDEKKKEESGKHTTPLSSSSSKVSLQLKLTVGSQKQVDPKHTKSTLQTTGTSSKSGSSAASSSAVPKEGKAAAPPPAKKPRHSSSVPSPPEQTHEDTTKKQPKSPKKTTTKKGGNTSSSEALADSATPQQPQQPLYSQSPFGGSGNRSIASTVAANLHSSRSLSSSYISLDDDPANTCDCFKLIMSSACPQDVKKAIKTSNGILKDKIDYLLDAHNTKVCLGIIAELRKLDKEKFFENPVTVDIAPEYFSYVRQPMDVVTLEDYVVNKKVVSVKEFIVWGRQIWQSCFTFNKKKDLVFSLGKKHSIEYENLIRKADWRNSYEQSVVVKEAWDAWTKVLAKLSTETLEKISRVSRITDLKPSLYFEEIRQGFFSIPTRELKYKDKK